jgi:hypothetical protein
MVEEHRDEHVDHFVGDQQSSENRGGHRLMTSHRLLRPQHRNNPMIAVPSVSSFGRSRWIAPDITAS